MDDPSLKNTLDKLRSRNWEMELLLSGFVLVLLLPVPDLVWQQGNIWLAKMNYSVLQQLLTIVFIIGLFGSRILIVNLVIYLILRGFWIGIVGLTSAFPKGINWANISYQSLYQEYLKRKTSDTESYVNVLNKISSSVFSFSFLLIFLIIAFFTSLVPITTLAILVNTFLADLSDTHWLSRVVDVGIPVLILIYIGLALIFLVDFLTLGLVKRIRWRPFMKLYFPLYRFFRGLTLASLYTPIYYTLISNVPKRTIAFVLTSYLLVSLFVTNFSYSEEIFYPDQESAYLLLSRHYEDQRQEPSSVLVPLIPSEYLAQDHLRLFLPYLVSDNDSLRQACPEVEIFRESGFTTDMSVSISFSPPDTTQADSFPDREKNVAAALQCLAGLYQISIDDEPIQPPVLYFYREEINDQPGLLTYLPVATLSGGPHLLTIRKRDYSSTATDAYQTYYIPFVKEK
ncbi:MAG: hypothetical protein AAF992_11830 [Bacteroidota bacterium]